MRTATKIGIAIYPGDGEDTETLLKNADTAMYHAKEQGRNIYQFYTPAMHAKSFEKMILESNLRRALDREEFVVYYQPFVNIRTGKIAGMEALVRWLISFAISAMSIMGSFMDFSPKSASTTSWKESGER